MVPAGERDATVRDLGGADRVFHAKTNQLVVAELANAGLLIGERTVLRLRDLTFYIPGADFSDAWYDAGQGNSASNSASNSESTSGVRNVGGLYTISPSRPCHRA
jgi:hypothetical protein